MSLQFRPRRERKKFFLKTERGYCNIKVLTKNMKSQRVVKKVSIPHSFSKAKLNKAYEITLSNDTEI